jgi:hypothetical protein
LDGDGDLDVVAAANVTDEIAWWENDGDESFTKHTIDGSFDGARSVIVTDLDSDGDVDVIGTARASVNGGEIAWWEQIP